VRGDLLETKVKCLLDDCVFYLKKEGEPEPYCSHAEKRHYLLREPCPLYKQDWNKMQAKAADLRKRFANKVR
jgi:hypothetical protein